MKKALYLFILTISFSVLVSSCSKEPDVENTSTVNMSGDWWVETFEDGSHFDDFQRVFTHNTSDNSTTQLWVDDLGHIWPFKGKFDIDYATLSFKPKTGIANLSEPGKTIDVIEGKIIPKGGHSKTGVVVDSIYLKLKFSDGGGSTYELKGHQRTGFFEDEY
jgi:hypothetical protein